MIIEYLAVFKPKPISKNKIIIISVRISFFTSAVQAPPALNFPRPMMQAPSVPLINERLAAEQMNNVIFHQRQQVAQVPGGVRGILSQNVRYLELLYCHKKD